MTTAPKLPPRRLRRRWWVLGLSFLVALLLASVWQWADSRRTVYQGAAQAVQDLDQFLNQLAFFPRVLARNPLIESALLVPERVHLDQVNELLALWAKTSGTQHIFVMDDSGTTRAASNHDTPTSFVGKNYGYRPYFNAALNNNAGSFFAVGATTGEPGYFLSSAVPDRRGKHIGVVVVKVDLSQLVPLLNRGENDWLIVDDLGVSILSSRSDWVYRSWRTLPGQREAATSQKRYQVGSPLVQDGRLPDDGIAFVRQPQELWPLGLAHERPSAVEPWTLVSLQSSEQLLQQFALKLGLILLGLAVAWLAWALYDFQRRRSQDLAHLVDLARGELEDAQQQLIQRQNWAALGRMSAAIAHEINQPLAGLRFNLASTTKLLERSPARPDPELVNSLADAKSTSERVMRIIETLRIFARRNELERQAIALRPTVQTAIDRFAKDRPNASAGIAAKLDAIDDSALVQANSVLLEQVVMNLLSNAVAATADDDRDVQIRLVAESSHALIIVSDNGHDADFPALQDLSKSSKPLSEGFGLGLELSRSFLDSIGGSLRAQRTAKRTEFIVQLLWSSPQ